jgi:hypothetical protein
MEHEQPSAYAKQSTTSETQADKAWTAFERDLDMLGRQLAALQVHTAALGSHLVESLEARLQEVKTQAESFRTAKEAEIEQVRQNTWRQAETAFAEARTKSAEAARQMWERAEPLRQGAKDVGEGLARAWGELRASFGKAATRLHTESKEGTTNGPAPASIEQRREKSGL